MKNERRESIKNFLSGYKVVIFDAEGVLFDTPEIYFQTHRKMADSLTGYNFTIDDQRELSGTPKEKGVKSVELFANRIGFKIPVKDKDNTVKTLMEMRDSLFDNILSESDQVLVKHGALKLLNALNARGVDLAISTSSRRSQLEKLFANQNEIRTTLFREIVCADDNPEYASSRDKSVVNNTLINRLNTQLPHSINSASCIMFEDSVEGVCAAKRSGIGLVIAVPDSHSRHLAYSNKSRFKEASLIIESLEYFSKMIS